MEDAGEAVTVPPVVDERPVAGDQLYVAAPEAVIVADEPEQIAPSGPITITGSGTTVTVVDAIAVQVLIAPVIV